MAPARRTVGGRLRSVAVGEEDPRVRATWRVLLAMPLLWLLTGGVLTGNLQDALGIIPSGGSPGSGLASSLLHGGFFLIALVPWARYLDRQPLSTYGISMSRDWLGDFLLGFGAVVIGQTAWITANSVSGGTAVRLSPSLPAEPVLVWLVLPFGALVLHAAVQQVVFFRVILKNAAEGFHSRGVGVRRAAVAAIPVAVALFISMHGSATPLRILDLAVAGGIFGLLYLHTGELGLGIGAHFGAFYSGTVVFALIRVTGSTAGPLGAIDRYGFPKMVIAYLVVLAWLTWRRGEIPLQTAIAQVRP